MKQQNSEMQFVVCMKNDGYAASLEVRKVYQVIPDVQADNHQLIRIIDESDEDYLYPTDYFVFVELPQAVVNAFAVAA